MKSLTREVTKEIELTPASPAPVSLRAKRTAERMAKSGKWVESLRCSDVSRLWSELHRIVSHHPLVRASRSAGLLVEEGASSAYTDLTQELFVQLLSKNRFEHYLDAESLELRRHRWIDVLVRAGDLVSAGLQHAGKRRHRRPANSDEVIMHC